MESPRRGASAYPWYLLPLGLISLFGLAYPMYVIRPFRYQGPRELAAALLVIQDRPWVELVCAVLALAAFLWYWRGHSQRAQRIVAVTGTVLVCAFAVLSSVNIYELLFHPDLHPVFGPAASAKVDPDDKVLAVKIGGSARAYPIRTIAYHHVINDVVGGQAIAATY